MEEYGKNLMLMNVLVLKRNHHYIGCFPDVVFNSCWNNRTILSCPNTDGNATRRLY